MKDDLFYEYASDAYYSESKDQEILRSRVEVLQGLAPFMGQLYSKQYIQKEVLKLTDEQIEQMEREMMLDPSQQQQEEPQNGQ